MSRVLLKHLSPNDRERLIQEARRPKGFASEEEFEEFTQSEADVVEQIKWVSKHVMIDNDPVEAKEAPCAEAWNMLLNYRDGKDMRRAFWKEMYGKIVPNRAHLDDEPVLKVDGEHIIDAIERQLKMGVVKSAS